MKTVRFLAGVLLVVSGVLHVIVYFQASDNSESFGVLLFGILYCLTGLLLFNRERYPLYLGIFIPLVGMGLSLMKFGVPELISMLALFKLLEIIAVVCCCVLLLKRPNR